MDKINNLGIIPDNLSNLQGKYKITNNTFITVAKSNPRDFIEVEIGDSKQPEFYPQVKLKRWDNEVNLSVRLIDNEEIIPNISLDSEKIKWEKQNRKIHFYELPISNLHPEGGYEFEIALTEKPETNRIEFSLQTKGLVFYYQNELTDDFVSSYAEKENISLSVAKRKLMPDNVVGSYAVYYKDKPINKVGGKQYRTGKVCHIYRPRIEDAIGNHTWGNLSIDEKNNLLYVDIPQDFLDTAVYPVTHAAGLTLGYTTMGVFQHPIFRWEAEVNMAIVSGTATSIYVALNGSSSAANCNFGLYNSDSVGNIGTHIAHGTSSYYATDTDGWYSKAINCSIVANNYYASCLQKDAGMNCYVDDTGNEANFFMGSETYTPYDSWQDNPTGLTLYNRYQRSIYTEYSEQSGLTAPVLTAVQDGTHIDLTWT